MRGASVRNARDATASGPAQRATPTARGATENANQRLRCCACGNMRDMQLRGVCDAHEQNRACNVDTCISSAGRVRLRGRGDYDSASRRRFPSHGMPAATQGHEAGCGAYRRELERECGPVHVAACDRFRPDAHGALDLNKFVCDDSRRDQHKFSGANSIPREVPSRFDSHRGHTKACAPSAVAKPSRLCGWRASCLPVRLRIRQARRPAAPQAGCLCHET
jgi:hypothetical protein